MTTKKPTITELLEPYQKVYNVNIAGKLNIALDWDGTVTSDPKTWAMVAAILTTMGHKVYIVTMRYPSETRDIEAVLDKIDFPVQGFHFTSRQPKKPFMLAQGININIWIDDNPRAANESALEIWGTSSPEGQIVIEEHSAEGSVNRLVDLNKVEQGDVTG